MAPDVSRETQSRLQIFADLVLRWTPRINLISPADRPHLWQRHIDDSLQLRALLPDSLDRAVDIGSGGGFPGLVLAIATGVPFDLVESDQRKAAFLREAIRATSAPARVHACRAEHCQVPPAVVVTARAVAPLPRLLSLIQPLLAKNGRALLLKGENAAAELTAAAQQWQMTVRCVPSRTDPRATILDITELAHVRRPA
jgi:16S rRNA (guanine527-N7)-methyltransferase